MEKLSLKDRIIKYFAGRKGQWVNIGEMEKLAMTAGYLAQNCGRRCRELENEGTIEGEIRNGSVWYKFRETDPYKAIWG